MLSFVDQRLDPLACLTRLLGTLSAGGFGTQRRSAVAAVVSAFHRGIDETVQGGRVLARGSPVGEAAPYVPVTDPLNEQIADGFRDLPDGSLGQSALAPPAGGGKGKGNGQRGKAPLGTSP